MMKKCNKFMNQYSAIMIRIVVALIFIIAGFGKLFASPGIKGFSAMLAGLHFPIPTVLAVIVGITELIGGIWLLSGWKVQCPAKLLSIIMIVAIISVHLKSWADVRYPLLLLTTLFFFIGHEPTCLLKKLFKGKKSKKQAKKSKHKK